MSRPLTTGFLIFPGFPMACLTSMIEPMRAANEISDSTAFEWQLVSVTSDKVQSSALIDFEPNTTLAQIQQLDLLVVLSSPRARFDRHHDAARLRELQRHGTIIGAVSGGVFPLVQAGIGSKKALAVHWCYKAAFQTEYPDQLCSDRVIELSGDTITAAGAAAAFDLSLHLIEQKLGSSVATEVACWFQHPIMRREGVGQAVPALSADLVGEQLPELVARAAQILSNHMEDPIALSKVAELLGITPRHLERSFKLATGSNPTQFYRKMRMEAARQMVLYTNDRLHDIGAAVGYGRFQTFKQHYEKMFTVDPKEDRKRINLFRVNGNLSVPSV